MKRDARDNNQLRTINFQINYNKYAEGSCLVQFGDTHVLCTATIEEKVPPFLKGKGEGWITAEYGMLPRATHSRTDREASKGKASGRTQEIQRLIGRSLRSAIDFKALGERQIRIDCDVIQADGGTRTASITGAFVALHLAIEKLLKNNTIKMNPIKDFVAAVSCGIVDNDAKLDLDYEEDSSAQADANFVFSESGGIIEMQSTAEKNPFTEAQFAAMFSLAKEGIKTLISLQKKALNIS